MNALVAISLCFAALPDGLSADDAARFEPGAAFLGMVSDEEVAPGGTLGLDLYFRTETPLSPDVQVFLHVESHASTCRMVHDRRPPAADGDGIVHHHVDVGVGGTDACAPPLRFEVFTGLWNRRTGKRWRITSPPTVDDRVHAGVVELVSGEPSGDRVAFAPSDMRARRWLGILAAWRGWLLGLLAAVLAALALRFVLRHRAPPDPASGHPRLHRAVVVGVLALFLASLLVALDFVKDDAYISFRYAHNLVTGDGLVFNRGERLEGITNFMWTLLLAPFEALGLDLFQVTEVLGAALGVAMLLVMVRTSRLLAGGDGLSDAWAAAWVASSSSLALWVSSGMEQPLAMVLPIASAWLLWRIDDPDHPRHAVLSGVLMGLGCLTRPEIHLIGALVGLPLVLRVLRARRLDATTLRWIGGLLAVTVPFHAFRLAYYGSLLPNTYYVKTGASALIAVKGLQKLHEMLGFNLTGALALLAPFAFIERRRTAEKLVLLGVSAGFMAYVVKVGVDEMRWHRLYLPALPFLALLGAAGLQALVRAAARVVARPRAARAVWLAGWALVLAAVIFNARFTWKEKAGFNGRGDLSGNHHPDMGKFVTRHERPGGLVAFQDMGSTPYHAPDLAFLDFIGLVDGTVARARHSYGLHAFTATEAHHNQPAFDADMRAYFYERDPEWVILTSYVQGAGAMDRVADAFAKDPGPAALRGYIGRNGYEFGIYDQRFRDRYVHVRTWDKSRGYYLSLFRRLDLWEQTPGEVVLDALPDGVGGVKAELAGGLSLLGSEVQAQAVKKHELFVTTWWRLPGPREPDTTFFIHVEKQGFRHPFDQVPGDWLYPAPRWRAGELLEHRTLVQLPWNLPTGTYRVYMGVYRRSTGARLDVTSGPDDGQDRLLLGEVTVRAQRPFLDHLIRPTYLDEQRKHPERIVDHGRPTP